MEDVMLVNNNPTRLARLAAEVMLLKKPTLSKICSFSSSKPLYNQHVLDFI